MDRYRISRTLAHGGMSEVFEAFVRGGGGFERRVVLKRLRGQLAADAGVRDAFYDEARILSRISHANVIQIFDFGELDGLPFQVLEHVDGEDLAGLHERAGTRGVAMPPEVGLWLALEVARGLEHVHAATDDRGAPMGIVHRDITPRNVLVSWAGDVKLIDFGVAFADQRLDRTLVGKTKGTLQFMAPEQGRGEQVDARADVFALGCVLHWCLTGYSPVDGKEDRMSVYVGEAPTLDAALPSDVAKIVRRATQPRRGQRYKDARAFAAAAWTALQARTSRDGRTLLEEWLGRLGAHSAEAPASPHAVGDLFDVALLDDVQDTGRDEAPVRRYATVASERGEAPSSTLDVTPSLGQSIPVGHDLEDPKTKLTTDRALAPVDLEDATAILQSAPPPEADQARLDPLARDIGDRVYGYRLAARLSSDDVSARFRATHELRADSYVVELFDPARVHGNVARALLAESRKVASVEHPGIASVLDCAVVPGEPVFVAVRAEHRRTLADLVAEEAPLSSEVVAAIGIEIAEALGAAHERELVHGALMPSRVLVEGRNGAERRVVFGFGVDAVVRAPDPDRTLDAVDPAADYRAPEVSAGNHPTVKSDLYGLGAILYALLSGAPPKDQAGSGGFTPLPELGGIEASVHRLLSRSPADRPDTARAVAQRLGRWRRPSSPPTDVPTAPPTRAPPPDPLRMSGPTPVAEPPRPPRWSGPMLAAIGFGVVIGLVAGARFVWLHLNEPAIQVETRSVPVEVEAPALAPREDPQVELTAMERRLDQSLGQHDLEPADLAGAPGVHAAYKACRAALERRDLTLAETRCATVAAGLSEVPISLGVLQRTLERVQAAMEARAPAMAAERRADLQSRLQRIAARVGPTLTEPERRRLLREVQELRLDISRS